MKSPYNITLIASLVIAITILLASIYSLQHIHEEAQSQSRIDMERRIKTFWELLRQKGTDFRVVDGRLLAGNYLINGNYELPDKIREIFGGTATIFMGNTRVSTNVLKDDGTRAIGTSLVGDAYDAIFKNNKPYRGEAFILGKPYFTAYDPIKNAKGETIGVLYVGVKKNVFLTRFDELRRDIALAILSIGTVFSILFVLLIQTGKRSSAIQKRALGFLQEMIDSIPNPVFYKDLNGRYLGCNKAFEQFLGISKSTLVGKSVYDVAPPEIADQYQISDQQLLDSPPGTIQTYESRVQDSEGILRDVIFYKTHFSDQEGSTGGLIGSILDITERKRIEENLRESEERYRTLFENAHDAIFTLRESTVVDCNRQAFALFGATAEQFVGHSVVEFSPERQPDNQLSEEKARRKIEAALSGEPQSFEWLHIRPDGTTFYVDVSLNRLTIADEVLVQAIVRDATMRRQTEQLMVLSEKMMTVGGLAAGAAHELNNPLGAILQNAQNIIRRISPELEANERAAGDIGIEFTKIREYMERRGIFEMIRHIDTSVNKAADIVANLLTMSQKSPSRVERILLPEIIDQAIALATTDYDLKKKFGFRDIVIVRDYADDLPKISADAKEIQQVIFNLLKNAAQACSGADAAHGPTITIRTKRQGTYAVLEIEDNGTGIPEELLPRIFEPFFTTRAVGAGVGLGLSVAYALIVNNHNGRISVESIPGKGSCFRLLLPLNHSTAR